MSKSTFKQKKKEVEELIKNLPSNKEIADEILNMQNSSSKVELKEDIKNSYYIFLNDTIYLSNSKKAKTTYARIVLISHEIRHSLQSKKMQILNFLLSNIEIIYFIVMFVLSLLNIHFSIAMYGYIFVFIFAILVRCVLEADAIYNSIKISKSYLNSKIDKKDTDKVISVYKFYISLLIPLMFVSLFAWKFIRMAILFFMIKAF